MCVRAVDLPVRATAVAAAGAAGLLGRAAGEGVQQNGTLVHREEGLSVRGGQLAESGLCKRGLCSRRTTGGQAAGRRLYACI